MKKIYYTRMNTPIGPFLVAGTDVELVCTAFSTGSQQRTIDPVWQHDASALTYATDPLMAYFEGEPINFDVPLKLKGTEFQCDVWRALQSVGHGETASYGEIAAKVGRPAASRAVGAANRVNCHPIIIPCHRIIGASGSLIGFGGGLTTKAWLLKHEQRTAQIELF